MRVPICSHIKAFVKFFAFMPGALDASRVTIPDAQWDRMINNKLEEISLRLNICRSRDLARISLIRGLSVFAPLESSLMGFTELPFEACIKIKAVSLSVTQREEIQQPPFPPPALPGSGSMGLLSSELRFQNTDIRLFYSVFCALGFVL